jgi:chromosome segregation ATPase
MPSRDHSDKFKLDMDYYDYDIHDDAEDEGYREEIGEIKLEKLSHRVTLITILIPILIAVIIVVSYLDIKQKVVQTQTSGTLGFQNISKNVESRFSSLSVRQAKLEDTMKKHTEALDKDRSEYTVHKKELEDKIDNLSNQMTDKKALSETARKFNTALTAIQEELTNTRTSIKNIEATATKSLNQMTTMQDETKKKFQSLSQTTAELSENKLGKNQLDLALKIRDLKLQEQFQEQTKALKNEIDSLKKKTAQLSKELNAALKQIKEMSKTKTVPKQSTSPSKKPTQASPPAKPEKGKILEQNLN